MRTASRSLLKILGLRTALALAIMIASGTHMTAAKTTENPAKTSQSGAHKSAKKKAQTATQKTIRKTAKKTAKKSIKHLVKKGDTQNFHWTF